MIQDYLMRILLENKDKVDIWKRLGEFFREEYLRQLTLKAQLQKGDIPENLSNFFSQSELDELKKSKEIKLHTSNKKIYKVQDEVVL